VATLRRFSLSNENWIFSPISNLASLPRFRIIQ